MMMPPRLPALLMHHFPDSNARYTRQHSARSSNACLCYSSVASRRGSVNLANGNSWWPKRRSRYRHPCLRHYHPLRCMSRHRHSRSYHKRNFPMRRARPRVFPWQVLRWKRSGLYHRYRATPHRCLISAPRPYLTTTRTAPSTRALPHHSTANFVVDAFDVLTAFPSLLFPLS
jgi:hypothetical protein